MNKVKQRLNDMLTYLAASEARQLLAWTYGRFVSGFGCDEEVMKSNFDKAQVDYLVDLICNEIGELGLMDQDKEFGSRGPQIRLQNYLQVLSLIASPESPKFHMPEKAKKIARRFLDEAPQLTY